MTERIVADPAEVAANRTELDISDWIKADGVDWGDGEIAAYMADMGYGSTPVDFRVPNRTITIPLSLQTRGGTSFETARQNIQAKVARWQQEGGWLKRVTTAGTLYCDVVNASLKLTGSWMQANRDADVEASMTLEALPDFYGPEDSNLIDGFSTNTITSGLWVYDAGSGTLSMGGQLVPSSTAEKRIYRTDRQFYPAEITVKLTTGASVTPAVQLIFKRQGASDYLRAGLTGGTTLRNSTVIGGTVADKNTTGGITLSASTAYWVRARIEGNKITTELFTSSPTPSSVAAFSVSTTLAGSDATTFGQGVKGDVGLRWVPAGTDERLDDFTAAPNVFVERAAAELTGVMYGIQGNYPARVRVVVDELQGQAQMGLMWGVRSRNYSSSSTARLAYEAEALAPLSGAAGTALAGASGGTAVTHTALQTFWTPILSTDTGGTASLTHAGSYRVWARAHTTAGTAVGVSLPQLRFVYGIGSAQRPQENDPVALPGSDAFYVLDMGSVRVDPLPTGTHRWTGFVQAKGAVAGQPVSVDRLWLQPIDESAGVLRGSQASIAGLVPLTARDDFESLGNGTNLNTRTAPLGGTWATAAAGAGGSSTDFQGDGAGNVRRTTTSDGTSGKLYGRRALFSPTYGEVEVGGDFNFSAFPTADSQFYPAALARYVDTSNFAAFGYIKYLGLHLVVLNVVVGGNLINLGSQQIPALANTWLTLRLQAKASGQMVGQVFVRGNSAPLYTLSGGHAALATGGALATGQSGIQDYNGSATAITRLYDNVYAAGQVSGTAVPTDVVLEASQTLELRTDGMVREEASGTTNVRVSWAEGDLPRLPVAGLEGRPVELLLKQSRGDFDELPDLAIDDLRAQVLSRPCWITVPGS